MTQDRFLVLLKDHDLLPVMYAGVGGPRNQPNDFTRLRHDFRLFLLGRLQLPFPALREGAIPVPYMPGQAAPIPRLLRPFFAGPPGQPEPPEALPFEELYLRFVNTYVGRYPVEDLNRMEHYFIGSALNDARRGLLGALYWLLVVRGFQQVLVQQQPQPATRGFNPAELTLAGDTPPVANLPENGVFGDEEPLQITAHYLQGRGIFAPTVAAVDRLYEEEEGALQRAMRARPTIYAAVLFITFSVRFEVCSCCLVSNFESASIYLHSHYHFY